MRVHPIQIAVRPSVFALVALTIGMSGDRSFAQASTPQGDSVHELVRRLNLDRYKETIRSLTQFGDRQQGTDRNKKALDWIEARLKSYGCAPERLHYNYAPAPRWTPAAESHPRLIASGEVQSGVGGSRLRGQLSATSGTGPERANLDGRLHLW